MTDKHHVAASLGQQGYSEGFRGYPGTRRVPGNKLPG